MLCTTKNKRIILQWGEEADTWSYKNPTPGAVIHNKDGSQQIGSKAQQAPWPWDLQKDEMSPQNVWLGKLTRADIRWGVPK